VSAPDYQAGRRRACLPAVGVAAALMLTAGALVGFDRGAGPRTSDRSSLAAAGATRAGAHSLAAAGATRAGATRAGPHSHTAVPDPRTNRIPGAGPGGPAAPPVPGKAAVRRQTIRRTAIRSPSSTDPGSQPGPARAVGSSPAFRPVPIVSEIGTVGSFLVIPSLGVKAPLVPTGAVGPAGTASLTIPADIHTVGWWDGTVSDGDHTVQEDAPQPGQPGVALIAGHIDSAVAGPGALYDLGELRPGDSVEIVNSRGRSSDWVVSGPPETTLKTELPPSLWVTSGAPKLALVTCGGPFDPETGHYVDNVIVWATPAPLLAADRSVSPLGGRRGLTRSRQKQNGPAAN